ncbi:hypothetical protein L1987_55785 [Smallanthus sonchifolius]|uniref:Uncharacterized protein n=1 Tax=Smallanthus sonchifolius TaxID=185202 RepID=A0ACB9EAM7_9ASTR|nr:hypothetical protein L1987_55785 [Smallanthus sonchifolius]
MASIHYSDMLLILIVFFTSAAMILHRRRRLPITNWPFVGMTPDLLLNIHRIHDFSTHLLKLNDGTFMLKGPWFTNTDMLLTSDPANIHHILTKNFHNYPKGPDFRHIFDILGDGIFNSDHELWELHRKTIMSILKHPDFHSLLQTNIKNKLQKGLFPLLNFISSRHQEIDLQEIFQRFTFDVICVLLLNYDPESLSIDLPFIPCEKAIAEAEEATFLRHILPERVWMLQKRFGLGKEKKLSEACKVLDEFIYKCLNLKDENNEEQKFWFLTSLMRGLEGQRGSSGDSRKLIKDTILNLMIAGRDTTSTTLSWFFYLLAQNPNVENNIRDEIKKHLGGGKWESLGVKELGEMVYLHGGLCEALRLYPPVALQHKSPATEDVLPSGHAVDQHARIILSFYSMGIMEGIWGEDCMEFRPERWFSRGGGIKHMKMVAIAILHHYHVELVESHEVCASDSVILQMKYGLK